jgi:hypothetical protein
MTDSPTPAPAPPPRRGTSGAKVAAIVAGSVLALFSLGLLAVGGVALWADGKKDEQGYVSTDTDRFHTQAAALRTENLDVDLGGAEDVVGTSEFGKVRLRVTPRADKDVFVGIARSSDVSAYLRGTAHATVTDLDYEPFNADYRTTGGARRAAPPAAQRIWAAQAQGAGTQSLTWDVADGDWSVVVMNADGSAGVDAGVKAGANVPFLDEVAWASIGGGALLLLLSGALLYSGARSPRPPRAAVEAPGPVPAAA